MKNIIFLLSIALLAGCVDHTFDEPPGFTLEVVDANANIGDLLDQWQPGNFVQITDELTFSGRVVANDESGNFYKQLVVEDETGGIQIRLDAIGLFNEFPIGREVFIKCRNLFISDYQGLPQLSAAEGSGSNIQSIAVPEPLISEHVFNTTFTENVEPHSLSITEVSPEDLNTFVKFDNVQFTAGSVAKPLADTENQFSLNHDIEDCSENEILLRTSSFASFADQFTPAGNGSIQGILSVFRGDYQLLLRDYSGISMDGERCDGGGENNNNSGDPVNTVSEDFQMQQDNQDIKIENWSNIAVKGTRKWRAKEFDGNVYAQATAYNDNSEEMVAWLITPKIKFDAPMVMELRTAVAFYVHSGLSVWYSKDFDGENVQSASWTELSLTIAGSGQDNYDWVDSGEIDLFSIEGEAYIGFKYEGNPANGTTSFIIDDVKIVDK
ncbi:DUF5689 domain-containing protein [Portibacter marinus]|uniref:DUF5689 domain-containing protein n=1 Tax=Portibacter marinus TaxID=2898660 RepID=UPI001F440034|nr:DUF5689 domain-containing protein [Portibacter marinus]